MVIMLQKELHGGTRPSDRLTYQDIVWLDICMEDIASFKEFQSQEQLLTIGSDSLNMKANILTIFF